MAADAGHSAEEELLSKSLLVEQKRLYFNLRQNKRGRFLKVAEVNRSNRSTVIIPESGWVAFRDMLTSFIDGDFSGAGTEVKVEEDGTVTSSIASATGGAGGGGGGGGAVAGVVEPSPQVWVENLPFSTTPEELRAVFEKCGTVEDVNLPRNAAGRSKGVAVVKFATAEMAAAAIATLNSTTIGDRAIRVRYDRYAT